MVKANSVDASNVVGREVSAGNDAPDQDKKPPSTLISRSFLSQSSAWPGSPPLRLHNKTISSPTTHEIAYVPQQDKSPPIELQKSPIKAITQVKNLLFLIFSYLLPTEKGNGVSGRAKIAWKDVMSCYGVNKEWYEGIDDPIVWQAMRGLVSTLPNVKFTQVNRAINTSITNFFTPANLSNPLIPFKNLGVISIGSEGTITKVKERCSGQVFAMKVVSLAKGTTIPYHIIREIRLVPAAD